jgi:hypothetical protein
MQAILSRAEAAGLGQIQFFTGKPCKHGHVSPRYVSTGNCIQCLRQYSGKYAPPPGGSVIFPLQRVHPDDLETLYQLVDYLNSKRGLPPAVRAGAQTVAPTPWESYLEKEMRKAPTLRPSLDSIRRAAGILGIPETYAATKGPAVDTWSMSLEDFRAEHARRMNAFAAERDREGYGPGETPPT